MKDPFKNVTQVMQGKSNDLHFILSKVSKLRALEDKLQGFLDSKYVKKVKVANLEGSTLTLLAANAAIATELRYQTASLLSQFKNEALLKQIKAIKCIISPHRLKFEEKLASVGKKLVISKETAQAISDIAHNIDDHNLRNSLERIAQHTKPKD